VGMQNDPVSPDPQSFAWYEVTGITPPHDRTLADVHDKVLSAWKDEQRQKSLDATTADIKMQIDSGSSFADVAMAKGLMVENAAMVTRLTMPMGDMSADALNASFSASQGMTGVAKGVMPLTSIVFIVDDITQPPYNPADQDLADVKNQLNQQI